MSAQSARNRIGAAGISIIILLAAFGIYYFVYAERQSAYFSHRDLRILRTVSDQIAESFKLHADIERVKPQPKPRPDILRDVFNSTSEQSVLGVFDQVAITDQKGTVLRSTRGVEQIASIEGFTTGGAWKKPEPIAVKALQQRGNHVEIVLHGDNYHLFTQPMTLDGDPRIYILAGFVSATKFNRESLNISYTLILAVIAALLLTVLSMPYLKLKLIDKLHRVRLADVLVLAVCTMCLVSVVTIVLLDLVTYSTLRSQCDTQLQNLAADIDAHVHREVNGALAALKYLDGKLSTPGANQVIPDAVLADPRVRNYPYLQSFFRIGSASTIVERWSAPNEQPRRLFIDVSDRDYYKDLQSHREWLDASNEPYTLKSVHSLSTGEAQAVVARHPAKPSANNVAVALGIPMLSLIDTVVAGDCKFVVVDESGEVQFHSESQRNLAENFFDETDHDRAVRAAVVGRQNEMLDIRYWGADQRAYVAPIAGTPWTVITFRDKVLLRTLNVEMIMITVVFMILYGLVFVLLLAAAALVRPSYRAPWLWPSTGRAHDYQRLIWAYLLISGAFLVSIYCMRPQQLMIVALTQPLIALFAMFLRLRRVQTWFALLGGFALMIVAVAWLAATFASAGTTEPDVPWPNALLTLAGILGALGILAALLPPLTENETQKPLSTPRFIGLGAMLTILLAILPTLAFFKAAYRIESESFVKYGQLRIAKDLESRTQRILASRPRPGRMSETLDLYYDFFFVTDVRPMPFDDRRQPACAQLLKEESILPPFLDPLLPKYSDQSVTMREMHHDSSRGNDWEWWRCGEDLDLRFSSVHGWHTFFASQLPYFLLRIDALEPARVPPPYPETFKADHAKHAAAGHDGLTVLFAIVLLAFLALAYAAMIYTMIRFMLQHVFLVDVHAPLPLPDGEATITRACGRNLLLLGRGQTSVLKRVKREDFVEVQLAELKSHEAWARNMTNIDCADAGKGVLITDFDTPATSADFGKTKLQFLERLIGNHGRNVVAITMTSPLTLLDEAASDPELHERWLALFEQFDYEIEERRRTPREESPEKPDTLLMLLRSLRASAKKRAELIVRADSIDGSEAHAKSLIEREASGVPMLKDIGDDLLARNVRGREQLYDELSERAAAYYAGLWATCSKAEKVVLLNIATDGFANVKDRHVIRRLMTRCLLYRDPSLCVMNETFRRFVLARRAECAALIEDGGPSAWDKLQKPLAVAVACFAIFFFSTQREMFDVTMGVVTGLAGGIPAFLRIIGLFLDPKSAVSTASAAK